MKTLIKFKMGSSIFFGNIEGYKQKDDDELAIVDGFPVSTTSNVFNLKDKQKGKDIFLFKNLTKEEFIKDTNNCETPMRVGKFLIPEFCEYIGFTIGDFEKLKPSFDKLDDKHKYEIIIRDSYIENNAFTLTEEQRLKAYKEYKKYR